MPKIHSQDQWEVTCTHTMTMTMCVCGDMFQAEGRPETVRRKEKAWNRAHKSCTTPVREGRKVFWLSFCDDNRPTGQQFLGACLIEVTAAEADEAALDIMLHFPFAKPNSEWVGAATKKAHALGCNPGGEIAFAEVPVNHPALVHFQFGVLMDRATVEAIDQTIMSA